LARPTVVLCNSGSRSALATQQLQKNGLTRVANLWKQVNRSSRMSLLALAYAMGFAAAAQRNDREHTLFQEWLAPMA
jgi:rhodanese-related sulfurtransferase